MTTTVAAELPAVSPVSLARRSPAASRARSASRADRSNAPRVPHPVNGPAARTTADDKPSIAELLGEIQGTLAPVWPLADYVAVNPFVGLADRSFLTARAELRATRDVEMLLPPSYFREQLRAGRIAHDDLAAAFEQCRREYPSWYAAASVDEFFLLRPDLDGASDARGLDGAEARFDGPLPSDERVYRTIAEGVDQTLDTAAGGEWSAAIVGEIARHCAAHYDEGQAPWPSPWKDLSLYEAWRESIRHDPRFEKLGAPGFRSLVAELPDSPAAAIVPLLARLGVPVPHWRGFLLAQYHSIPGWSSYVMYRVREASRAERACDDLTGLLAMRLAYDAALAELSGCAEAVESKDAGGSKDAGEPGDRTAATQSAADGLEFASRAALLNGAADAPTWTGPSREVLERYLLQVAAESRYRRRLCAELTAARAAADSSDDRTTADVQMVFCIDVRSEVMRRHLERAHPSLETFGFAGFFGLAMEYVELGQTQGQAQCPVLLKPGIRVAEGLPEGQSRPQDEVVEARRSIRWRRQVWKGFQSSAASCFSFVESLGLGYLTSLIGDSFGWSRKSDGTGDGLSAVERDRLGPVVHACAGHGHGLSLDQQTQFAESMLRNLGLTERFARLVVLCGHASETTNNPYRAGLDCGACGGHSGETNARVAAQVLNRPEVRAALRGRGIDVPAETWFAAAVHVTTTDEIRLCDAAAIPESHRLKVNELLGAIDVAGAGARAERATRLGATRPDELTARSRDWSEVRPEWGLAGNAAFIVAPRARTRGLDLGGRTFLHSYDHRQDADGRVLELIMTAPMVVTNWINLQYYASAVDNRGYGSGNKVLHNMVGQFGVYQGNGGDLMTGLPWQSVHDGERFQHEPLRLSVVIEAPRAAIDRVLQKHAGVLDLVRNGWLTLLAIEDERFFQYIAASGWIAWSGRRSN